MDQAAQAEVMMAQLGLNMDQTQTLMPTVMSLATAANIDLADSLDYLYYTLNALGMPMEYANTLSDQMSKTAAISAADIDTLGQSMQRLGSGAQFFAGEAARFSPFWAVSRSSAKTCRAGTPARSCATSC